MWFYARAPYSLQLAPHLARVHAAYFRALTASAKKCLVVDLDNTLWGGILGEDGVRGVQLGATFPGNIYKEVQQELLELSRRGVLLAINSKNNPADVDQMFQRHPDMVLQWTDFAAHRVNWQPKPQNMAQIAAELNIGLDSLVYLDDNPAECALMRQSLPEVETVLASDSGGRADPLTTLQWLRNTHVFDRLSWTAEDLQRTQSYRQQSERRKFQAEATSMEDFLRGLQMEAEIALASETTLPRVSELVQKTNQFNVTTRRYALAEIERLRNREDCEIFTMRLRDRFGDHGIIAMSILLYQGASALIDTLLLSCRVIGRGVETALLSYLLERARAHGATTIFGEFVPTKKNAPAADLYPRHGFAPYRGSDPVHQAREAVALRHHENGSCSRWVIRAAESRVTFPDFIKLQNAATSE
jgi:FkbH-like protein